MLPLCDNCESSMLEGRHEKGGWILHISDLSARSKLQQGGIKASVPEKLYRWSAASDSCKGRWKSNLTKVDPSPMSSRKRVAACSTASQPPGTPTPILAWCAATVGTVKVSLFTANLICLNNNPSLSHADPRSVAYRKQSVARTWRGQVPAKRR